MLTVTFNRPERHNAMTWAMYDGLYQACDLADSHDDIAVMVLRGAGEKSFVSGTDISQFGAFSTGADGVAYERRIERVLTRIESMRVPTVAAIRGYCVGAGIAIAAVCDLRVATRSARFGAPIARTLGNCLSMNTYSLLVEHLGRSRTVDLLLRARLISGEEAHAAGFVCEVCDDDEFDSVLEGVVAPLLSHAPLSMWACKEAVRRLRVSALPNGDDLVAEVFASSDFHHAVEAFQSKRSTSWAGR
jgi:enoyl-CoA hydratase/carnithine racemase